MPSLTLASIQARTRAVIRDTDEEWIPDSEITEWVNEAQEDIAHRLKLARSTKTTGTTSGSTLAFPTRAFEIRQLILDGDDIVDFVDDEVFESWQNADAVPPRTLGRVSNSVIEMYPTPDAGTDYELWCDTAPADLSGASDTSSLPSDLHLKLVHYARAQALLKDREYDASERYMAQYLDGLQPKPNPANRFVPPLRVIRMAPTPWDVGSDVRHQ